MMVNNYLEWIRKKANVTNISDLASRHILRGLKKITKPPVKIAGIPTELFVVI
jgi:hypothetical protein